MVGIIAVGVLMFVTRAWGRSGVRGKKKFGGFGGARSLAEDAVRVGSDVATSETEFRGGLALPKRFANFGSENERDGK